MPNLPKAGFGKGRCLDQDSRVDGIQVSWCGDLTKNDVRLVAVACYIDQSCPACGENVHVSWRRLYHKASDEKDAVNQTCIKVQRPLPPAKSALSVDEIVLLLH